ncbi:MAG: glyoxalase [Dehalococcoidia bacterium]|nr:glyoxalase [Dehalococcoidia bacterium]
MGAKVVHFEVLGKDGKKLQQFYGSMFDWNVDANNPMQYGLVNPGDAGLGGGIGGTQDGGPQVTFYVEVPDLAAALTKAESLGGKKISEPMEVPGGPTLAHFADPDGNVIGLMQAGSM